MKGDAMIFERSDIEKVAVIDAGLYNEGGWFDELGVFPPHSQALDYYESGAAIPSDFFKPGTLLTLRAVATLFAEGFLRWDSRTQHLVVNTSPGS